MELVVEGRYYEGIGVSVHELQARFAGLHRKRLTAKPPSDGGSHGGDVALCLGVMNLVCLPQRQQRTEYGTPNA